MPARASARDTKIEKWLDSKGVAFEYVPQVGLEQIDFEKSLQTQARFKAIEPPIVDRYAIALQNGDPFPPIVLHKRGRGKLITIDGNHRAVAAQTAGLDTYPPGAYLVTADAKTVALLQMEANTRHGLPTNVEERVAHAIFLIDNGADTKQAAAAMQVPEREVKKRLAKVKADRRADDAGIQRSRWERLQPSVRQRLVNIGTDEGFAAAADLAYRADLGVSEVFDMVQAVNATKSGKRQREIVDGFASQYADRIQAAGGGNLTQGNKRGGFTPRQRFFSAMTTLRMLPEDLTSLADTIADTEVPDVAQRLNDEIVRLTAFKEKLEAKLAG